MQIPAPPASSFEGSAGGDGWALAFTPSAVYNVFHHQQTLQVACHNQADASPCWSPKTITDTANSDNFAVGGQPGLWMDQGSGHLFVFASEYSGSASAGTAATAGVVCVDTTQPAATANPFCGFTPLSGAGASPLTPADTISGVSDPVVVNHRWYAFDHVNGQGAGNGANQLLCFDLSTLGACAGQPYTVNIGLGASGTSQTYDWPEPAIAAIGNEVIVGSTTSVNAQGVLGCFNVSTGASCGGSFPIALTNGYPGNYGAVFPLLNSAGQVTGFCLPDATDECYSLTGASVATPANMTTVVPGNSGWDGPAIVLGPRAYIADGSHNQVECYDYSTNASCTNFPHALANQDLTYSVNSDPQRPSCIWTNADNGSAQIQNFDAYTGGACGSGSLRVISSAIVVPLVQCQPANFTSLTIVSPAPSVYGGGTVQFQDNDGVPIAGIPTQNL
ncbi:MAG TPA: hypothetical protein VFH58_14190, partial [Acidimicrobiales bacterium]|nr:hypothetical protein [Acidimicrobiales bacterium]